MPTFNVPIKQHVPLEENVPIIYSVPVFFQIMPINKNAPTIQTVRYNLVALVYSTMAQIPKLSLQSYSEMAPVHNYNMTVSAYNQHAPISSNIPCRASTRR